MNEQQIKELRAHAGKLVAEGKPLSGVFEWWRTRYKEWTIWIESDVVPPFSDGEWRIAKPKKQLIDWPHPYFKGCATKYGELIRIYNGGSFSVFERMGVINNGQQSCLRLVTPANEDSNWQYFRSTPENDAKLRELAKMVKVEVRYWNTAQGRYGTTGAMEHFAPSRMGQISNFRITGLQDGWTDNPEEAK